MPGVGQSCCQCLFFILERQFFGISALRGSIRCTVTVRHNSPKSTLDRQVDMQKKYILFRNFTNSVWAPCGSDSDLAQSVCYIWQMIEVLFVINCINIHGVNIQYRIVTVIHEYWLFFADYDRCTHFMLYMILSDETSKFETGLSADWVYFAPFQTDTQVTVLLCWALSDLKTPILFLLSLWLNTALHYALLALLSLSTLVFRNNMCHCLSVWDVLIARWAVDISQLSNHSELHWWDLKGRNRTVCRLSLYIYIYTIE